MTGDQGTIGITGATGYLGSRLVDAFRASGWDVVRLVRRPGPGDRQFALGAAVDDSVLTGIDLLVHAAYDMAAISEDAVWQVNVGGSRLLLNAAAEASVARVVVISSMSAYHGTHQLYGRAKLAIEAMALGHGASVVRPGLVIGPSPGGMAGTLARLCAMPVTPRLTGVGHQYALHEEDLVSAMLLLARGHRLPDEAVGLAHPVPLAFPEVLGAVARHAQIRPPRLVPVPWQLVAAAIRSGERLGLHLPLRSDSLLGLRFPASEVQRVDVWTSMGLHIRAVNGTHPPPGGGGPT